MNCPEEKFVLSCNGPRKRNGGQFKPGEHWRTRRPYWSSEWCRIEYEVKQRSAVDIAQQFGVTENAVLYWLKKHGIACRSMSEIRSKKKWGSHGSDNPMWNRKGELNPNWKGGISPERQAFYSSPEWKRTSRFVWKRDASTCQRCGMVYQGRKGIRFNVHHIVSFADVELRADPDNLILLCNPCHDWVHSRANAWQEYLHRKEV